MAAFGIHFGTCSACLAVYKDGQTDVIANDLGDRVTPCVVAFTEFEQSVGAAAKQGIIRNAQNTICHVKQVIGKDFNDQSIQDYIKEWPVTVTNNNGVCRFEVEFQNKPASFSPVEIATVIYAKVLETAESHGGRGIKDAVLAVPSNFTVHQREQISEAACKAGFNVLRLINESAAAALAYDIGQTDPNEECNVMVLRVGGTSTDVSIININRGMYKVIKTVTLEKYGGENFTNVLTTNLVSEFKRQTKSDISQNRRAMTKLRLASEVCKHTLSTLQNAQCAVDSLYDGIDFHYNVSRGRFEVLCNNLLQESIQLIEQILRETQLNKSDIKKVILCGGGSNVPILQKTIGDYLKESTILSSITSDEVIAIGAAKQAAFLVGKEMEEIKQNEESCKIKCLSKAVTVKVGSETSGHVTVLPQHSLIPSRKQHNFSLLPDQTSLKLEIYETDNDSQHDLLAKIIMRDLPVGCTVNTNFHLRRDGDLHITCHEESTKKEESVTIGIS